MKKLSKLLAMLLAVAMLMSCVGCGSTTNTSNSTSTDADETAVTEDATDESAEEAVVVDAEATSQEAEEESVAAVASVEYPLSDELVTLTLFFSVSPNLASMIEEMSDITAYRLAEEATNVTLDAVISTPETTSEKFQVMIASGTYTDLIHGVAQNYSGGLDKAISDEVIVDLNPYLEEYAPDYTAFLDSNETAKKLYTTEEGCIGAIQGLSYSFVQGTIIRDDWLEDLNLDVPETIDELEEVLFAVGSEYGAMNSIIFTTGNIYIAAAFNLGNGTADGTDGAVYNVDADGVVSMVYFEDNYYTFIETLARWNQEGLFTSDFISLFGSGVADSYVLSDDCGFWMGAQDNLGSDYASTYTGTASNFSSLAIPMVTQEAGQTVDTGTLIGTSGEPWSVTTSCEMVEIAVAYLNWFFTEEGTLACNYGEEGVAFEYDESGTPVYTDLISNNPDGLSSMQAQWIYCNFQAPYIQDDARNDSLYSDEIQRTALSIWDSNRTNDLVYYGELTTEEAEDYNTYATDLETYASETLLKYILNEEELTEDSWETFLATLTSMGAETMVELKQQAYDRYLSK